MLHVLSRGEPEVSGPTGENRKGAEGLHQLSQPWGSGFRTGQETVRLAARRVAGTDDNLIFGKHELT